MDEVLFRSAQNAENLQIRAELAATNAKDTLVVYIGRGKIFFINLWNSEGLEQLRGNVKNRVTNALNTAKDIKIRIVKVAHPKQIYHALVNLLSKKLTKRDIFFICSGLVLGCFIGLAVGLSLRKKRSVIRYMQAIQCTNSVGIESVHVVEDAIAPNECGDHDVLVNVKAASVSIIDTLICNGYGKTYRRILGKIHKKNASDLSVTLGRDCTGIIVDVGNRVKGLEVGDEVWLTVPFWAQGTLCQSILVSENRVTRKPKNIGFEGACSLPYAGSLALSALSEADLHLSNTKGKKILVLGGCTPVGCVLLQILNFWNALITTTSYKRALPVVKALGASEIILLTENAKLSIEDQNEDSILKELENHNDTFDVIINTILDVKITRKISEFLKDGGVLISTLPPKLRSDSCGIFSRYLLYWYIWLRYKLENLLGLPINNIDETHLCNLTLDRLTELVEDGHLQTVVDKVYQPQDIEIALHHIQSPQSIGSTVITFR